MHDRSYRLLMDRIKLLSATSAEFASRLETVADNEWRLPTPCTDWDVRGLVNHLVTADTMSVRLLAGASREEVVASIGRDHLGDTLLHTWDLARAIGGDDVLDPATVGPVVFPPK